LGKTMARNVRLVFDTPLQSGFDEEVSVPVAELKMFAEGIPSLPPGKRIVFLFDSTVERPKELPSAYRVTLYYEGERGPLPPEELLLDLDLYRNLLSVRRDTIHQVSETLKRMERRMNAWTASLGGGLLVVSPDDKRRRDEEIVAELEEERAAEQSADGQGSANGRARLAGRLLKVVRRLRRG